MANFFANVEWNEHDVEMAFTAEMEWDDYGVPGSPRWLSPTNIKWGNYEVDGIELTAAQMLAQFGKEAVDELDKMLEHTLDEAEWEEEEPDYDYDYEPDYEHDEY